MNRRKTDSDRQFFSAAMKDFFNPPSKDGVKKPASKKKEKAGKVFGRRGANSPEVETNQDDGEQQGNSEDSE